MGNFNDIGISNKLDFPRIKKLLIIGVFASVLHLVADFILGWGTEDESLDGILRMFSAYTGTSDGGIFAAALLGLFGMVLEGLGMFGIYRLMAEKSPECAHGYRTGILGYLMFGACGYHVPVCAAVFLLKHGLASDLIMQYAAYFLLPAFILFWIFFAVLQIYQIAAFAKGYTPYPKYAWVFSIAVGMVAAAITGLFGNYPFMNAMTCAWIAFGNLWMFGGLLLKLKSVSENYGKK